MVSQEEGHECFRPNNGGMTGFRIRQSLYNNELLPRVVDWKCENIASVDPEPVKRLQIHSCSLPSFQE